MFSGVGLLTAQHGLSFKQVLALNQCFGIPAWLSVFCWGGEAICRVVGSKTHFCTGSPPKLLKGDSASYLLIVSFAGPQFHLALPIRLPRLHLLFVFRNFVRISHLLLSSLKFSLSLQVYSFISKVFITFFSKGSGNQQRSSMCPAENETHFPKLLQEI